MTKRKTFYLTENTLIALDALYINRIAKRDKLPLSSLVDEAIIELYKKEFSETKNGN